LSFERVRQLVIQVFDRFRETGYMEEAFGGYCVDAGEMPGTLGQDPNGYFLQAIGRDGVWPYDAGVVPDVPFASDCETEPAWRFWDEDTLFDVIETLHDLVSKPLEGWYHDFSGCGWHHNTFDASAGQREFREEVARILRMGDPAYDLSADGEVVEATPDEFRNLVSAGVPDGTEHDLVQQKMDAAIKTFLARGATNVDRQRAVRDLADVLEHLREDMKTVMLPRDESELFNIANNFAIRHNNRQQRSDYDRSTWLRWMFYVYLATIHAVLRVRDRHPD
jgi:hypothetical protein